MKMQPSLSFPHDSDACERSRAAQRATGIPADQGYLHVLDDKPDNRILEFAVAGHADAIATGDSAMLELTCGKPARRSRETEIDHLLRLRG